MPYNDIEITPLALSPTDEGVLQRLEMAKTAAILGIPVEYLEYSRKRGKMTRKSQKTVISAEKRQIIVKREKARLVALAAPHGTPAEAITVRTRGNITILYAKEVGEGDPNLYRAWEGEESQRILIGGDISPLVTITIVTPQLVTMVKEDGTVVRGASEEVRSTLRAWLEESVRDKYNEWLASLGGPLEIEVKIKREGDGQGGEGQ